MKKTYCLAILFLLITTSISWAQTKEDIRSYNEYSKILKQIEAPDFDATTGEDLIKRFEKHTGLKYKPAGVYSDQELIPDYSGLRDNLANAGIEENVINRILNENGIPVYGWDNHVSSIKDYNTVNKIFNSVPMVPGKPYLHPASWISGTHAGIDASERLQYIHGLKKEVEYRVRPGDYTTYESPEKKLQRDEYYTSTINNNVTSSGSESDRKWQIPWSGDREGSEWQIPWKGDRKRAGSQNMNSPNAVHSSPQGAIDPRTGKYFPPAGDHGVIDPETGRYYNCVSGICR